MSTVLPGAPSSFVTNNSVQVTFALPRIALDPGPPYHHYQGTFHMKGHIVVNYANTTASNEHMDGLVLAIGYNTIIKNDDSLGAGFPAVLTVPGHTSGSATFDFDLDISSLDAPFGKDPRVDLFCGPGEFYCGLQGGNLTWFTNSGTKLNVTGFVLTCDLIKFTYDIVEGSLVCGAHRDCPGCTGIQTICNDQAATLCATKMTGVPPQYGWEITGPGININGVISPPIDKHNSTGFDQDGWIATLLDSCSIFVNTPCIDFDPLVLNTTVGPYTAVVNAGGIGYETQFMLKYCTRCHGIIPPPPPVNYNAFNLQDKYGRYHATMSTPTGMSYKRSDFGTNASAPGWATEVDFPAPTGKTFDNPRVIVDDRLTARLFYGQYTTSGMTADGVFVQDSNDDGLTWNGATNLIAGGKHPTIAIGQDGTFEFVIAAAYVGPNGGPGVITARKKGAGDTDFGAPFNFADGAGAALPAADDTFHVQQARDDQSRWMLHMLLNGATSTTHYVSYDECDSFALVS